MQQSNLIQTMTNTVIIEERAIGVGEPTFLIAEVSANHDRNLNQALALVDIAAEAGWDSIKLQTYDAETLSIDSTHPSTKVAPIWGASTLYELYSSVAMPMEFHKPLFDRAKEKNLLPLTTVYDPKDLAFIEGLGCAAYKIASFELTFDDLLVEVAYTKKPIILSTGTANLSEVEHALEILDRNGSGAVILLHCCSAYPSPDESVNLLAMDTLRNRFGRLVGFSDHTVGGKVPIIASAMGAVAIEKHVTNDVNRTGPDHRFSCSPDTMAEIAEGVKAVHKIRGTGLKTAQPVEEVNKLSFRRSAFALRDLSIGHRIEERDFRFVRPCSGIPANRKSDLIGKQLVRSVKAYDPITYDDIYTRN